MPILVFARTLLLEDAKALVELTNNATYRSHHNWERNVRTTFESSSPSTTVIEIARIITEVVRKPSYCFVVTDGANLDPVLIKIKEANQFLGIVNINIESNDEYRKRLADQTSDMSSAITFSALRSNDAELTKTAMRFLGEIKDTEFRELLLSADASGREELIDQMLYQLSTVELFQSI